MDYVNDFINSLKFSDKESMGKLYIYGAGCLAGKVSALLRENGIEIDACIVDDEYLPKDGKECFFEGVPILPLSIGIRECCTVVLAILWLPFEKEAAIRSNAFVKKVYDVDFGGAFVVDVENTYSDDFLVENGKWFLELFKRFADYESRRAFMLFVAQKYTGMFRKEYSAEIQYFDDSIMHFCKDEVFLDCGAYRGDTVSMFLEVVSKKFEDEKPYGKIIAFEADASNYDILCEDFKDKKDIVCYPLGVWDRSDTLYFSGGMTTNSRVSNVGIEINVDKIDNVVGDERVTFIKMDIEGSELRALKGAENTIIKNKPKLAICVYHKSEDLVAIPRYILSIVPDYKLYLRNYGSAAVETVLYAVPTNG